MSEAVGSDLDVSRGAGHLMAEKHEQLVQSATEFDGDVQAFRSADVDPAGVLAGVDRSAQEIIGQMLGLVQDLVAKTGLAVHIVQKMGSNIAETDEVWASEIGLGAREK